MSGRGSYKFSVGPSGRVEYTPANRDRLTRLLLDWQIIDGCGGPGTAPDDHGAWHVFCHLAAAGAVHQFSDGTAGWTGITYDAGRGRYAATTTIRENEKIRSLPLEVSRVADRVRRAHLVAFVEGASRGHILHRFAVDPGDPETDDRRQDYNQTFDSSEDGGPVWEHWTVSRDIVTNGSPGASLVDAFLLLCSMLGGRFVATIARGRSEAEYGHLRQLCAMIEAGLVSRDDALLDVIPEAIPPKIETRLHEATPAAFLEAANEIAQRTRSESYYMFSRKRESFAPASLLRAIAMAFR